MGFPAALKSLCTMSLDASPNTQRVPTPGGEAILLHDLHRTIHYGQMHFAPARREGDWVFVSGVVAAARDGVPLDLAGFEAALRRAFEQIDALLVAAGCRRDQIVELQTFHVFGSPALKADKSQHIASFGRIKDEFVPEPYPAWTAVGVSELFPEHGLVEIQVRARRGTPA
jgi:enamine deaminase RidA (YjgF/YER057c/UK114 family)